MTKYEFRRALVRLGWSQGAAAAELGYSIRTCHGWANGVEIPLVVQKFLRVLVNCGIDPRDPCMDETIKLLKPQPAGAESTTLAAIAD